MKRSLVFIALMLFVLLSAENSIARIELVTVPVREYAEIAIDRNNNALVQEGRTVTVKEGSNVVQFDWSNVSIDLDTVQIWLDGAVEGVNDGEHTGFYLWVP